MASSKLARARISMTNLRRRLKSQEPVRALSAFAGGAAVGSLERINVLPPAVLGVPTKPIIATALFALGAQSTLGSTQSSMMLGLGEGVIGAYGYAAGKSGNLVAGDELIGDEIESEREGL